MHFGLASLTNTMKSWRAPRQQNRLASQYNRRLVGEQLESRFALSTLVGDVSATEDPSLSTDPSLSPSDPAAIDPPPTDPPPSDPLPSGDLPVNTAPLIVDFVCVTVGDWCTLQGRVIDDVDPTGLIVHLDGVIQGEFMVDANDSFSYSFQLSPELHGLIFASTNDLQGLLSNIPFVMV